MSPTFCKPDQPSATPSRKPHSEVMASPPFGRTEVRPCSSNGTPLDQLDQRPSTPFTSGKGLQRERSAPVVLSINKPVHRSLFFQVLWLRRLLDGPGSGRCGNADLMVTNCPGTWNGHPSMDEFTYSNILRSWTTSRWTALLSKYVFRQCFEAIQVRPYIAKLSRNLE
jgi:hypothetical protein